MTRRKVREHFDEAYYERFYNDAASRAASVHDATRQGRFIASYLRYLGLDVKRILDLGCGLGRLLRVMKRQYPRARCEGVEVSDYLCQRYGWSRGAVHEHRADAPYDLVICHDVIQYLGNADAATAVSNLAGLSRGALLFGVLTAEDWCEHCDRARTDDAVHIRSAGWYRRRLARHFVNVGGGLYLKRPLTVTVWSLDRL